MSSGYLKTTIGVARGPYTPRAPENRSLFVDKSPL
jgi:hypothetical protein